MSIELARLDSMQFRELIRQREREGFTTPALDAEPPYPDTNASPGPLTSAAPASVPGLAEV